MKKILLATFTLLLLCTLGFAASKIERAGDLIQPYASFGKTPVPSTQNSVQPTVLLNSQSVSDMMSIDITDNSGGFNVGRHHDPPTILVDVTETEPNDTKATADPINPGDRVFCGQLTNTTDPSDYFVFTLDNTYAMWQVEVYTYAPAGTECTPAIAGTRVYLYGDTVTANPPIGYDDATFGTYADMVVQFLPPGTYVFRVRQDAGASGYYHAELICTEQPCTATCPPGGIAEGEVMPDTYYVDTYNLGCTSPGGPFIPYTVGQTMCGTAATWVQGGYLRRDIDWYEFTLTQDDDILFTSKADFLSLVYIFRAPCPGTFITGYIAPPCYDLAFTASLTAGTYYVQFLPAQFGGLPAPPNFARYNFTITTPTIGDNCLVPISVPILPYTDTRTNCGLLDDYQPFPSLTGEDAVYQMILAETTAMDISLCNTVPSTFDTWLGVWAEGHCGTDTFVVSDDDFCTSPAYGTSKIVAVTLPPGTYYILVDTYGNPCQQYQLDITPLMPCAVDCPPGATPEGEGDCFDGYVDLYNSGCNDPAHVFTPTTVGQTVCGTTGYFVTNDTTYRDTDWYTITTPGNGRFILKGIGEFPLQLLIIRPGPPGNECTPGQYAIVGSIQTGPCDTAVVDMPLAVGTYYLWAGPWSGTVPCGSTYWFTTSWEAMPDFPQVGLAETGNVPDVGVSNFAALGENSLQGNTFGWNSNLPRDYAGTFVFGNSATNLWWKYGDNPSTSPPRGNVPLDMTNPFHPTAGWDDNDAAGIDVSYCGAGFTTPVNAGDIFIHAYTLVNTGTSTVNNLYAAVYMDWDINTASDTVYIDRTNKVIAQEGAGTGLVMGWTLVNDVPLRNLTGISQDVYSYHNYGETGGWLYDSLWVRLSSSVDGVPYWFTDMGSLLSTGPFTVAPGDSVVVVFAQIGATSLANVVDRANLARTLSSPCYTPPVSGCDYMPGDINSNGAANGIDVVYGVTYLKGGATPKDTCDCRPDLPLYPFYGAFDVNGNCATNGIDITFFVAYLKGMQPALKWCLDCPPAALAAPAVEVPGLKARKVEIGGAR